MPEMSRGSKSRDEDNLRTGFKGGAISFVLQVSSAVLGFSNTVILARILSTGGLGEVILALSVMNICSMIAGFGMNGAMMRFVPVYLEKGRKDTLKGIIYFALKFCFAVSLLFVALLLLLSKFISINVFHTQGLLKLLPIVAVILPVYVLNDVISGVLRGYKDTFRALMPHMFISPLLKITVFLLLSITSKSPVFAVVAVLVAEIISIIFSISFLLTKVDRSRPSYEWSECKKLLDVGSTMIFTILSVFLYTQADLWIVGMLRSTEEVGIYGVISRLVVLISFSLGAFSTIIPSIISSVYSSGDSSEMQRVIRESTRWILTIAMPVVLIILIEGRMILKYAYGERFLAGYTALVILSVGQLVNSGAGLVGWLLQMTGGHRTFMKITIFWGILNVILDIILIRYFGIVGAALSTAFCLAMVNIVSVFVIRSKLSVITLARGVGFDVLFIFIISVLYLVILYNNIEMGSHLLLVISLIIYMTKSVIRGDLPVQYLLHKYRP